MTPELYQRLKPLYDAALDVPREKRAQFVAEACGNDEELRVELEALLAANETGTGSLDAPFISFRDFARKQAFSEEDVVLDRFRIVRLLGFGGMGEVYEAEDHFLRGVHVALKTILPNVAGNPNLQKRFEREVLLAREVAHSNLCPIYDIFHCEDPPPGYLFLTMKLLPGQNLAERLRLPPPITSDEGLSILRQTSLGIAAIHAAGIVHRDIKPNNIMIDGTGPNLRLWITDFGLARAYETESTVSSVGTVAGTPGYIAPELYLGHPPSQASDLFALGVVLHEVFAGQKPTPIPDTHSYTVGPRLTTPKVPALSVRLVTECLQDDPQRRCTAFGEALEVIDSKLDRSLYTGRTRQFWTRRRFAATAAAGAFALAGGAWWRWDDLENALHPLPPKRFVALLNWPKTSDAQLTPMLNGALSAIKSELSRLEAFDRDLFVISPEDSPEDLSRNVAAADLKKICDPLGANLVLAASASFVSKHFQLLLQLLDPSSNRVLREKRLAYALAEITSLPGKAVYAAGSLLNLGRYLQNTPQAGPGTQSAAAFTAFQSAEALMNEPDDAGLDAAIEKYKQAVELDPHYALAHAELAEAYVHSYGLRHDPAALELARGNCEHALALDPSLVDAHLARAVLLEKTGNEQAALDEFAKALALDPSNPETLWEQAQVYARLNRWAEAEQIYERIISQRPNSWVTYNEKGNVLAQEGRYREAVQAFRTATVASPRCSLAFANLGGEYLEIGKFQEAADSSKKSMALRPNALAAVNTSQALRYQGKSHDALPFALKSVELDPADDTNWLELGDCYTALGKRPREAKDAYLRAAKEAELHLDTDATDGPKWMLLALYKVKSGNPQNALLLVQKAESLGSRDMGSQLCKVRVLELIGKRDQALATVSACFSRGATNLQITAFPDMQSLQKDPRYVQLVQSISPSIPKQVSG
jgi:eukaryotic-like serine/threonine-protein kinase